MKATANKAALYLRDLLRSPKATPVDFGYRDVPFFFQFVRPVWRWGATSLVLMLVGSALGSLLPLSSKLIIDYVVQGKDATGVVRVCHAVGLGAIAQSARQAACSVNWVLGAVLVVTVVVAILALLRRYVTTRFQEELTFNVQTSLFSHIIRFPLGFFRERETGYVMSRVSDDVQALERLFSQRLSQVLMSVFYLVFSLFVVFSLSTRLAVVALAILPFYVLTSLFFGGRLRSRWRAVMEDRALVSRRLHESLSGVELVKSYAGEAHEERKVEGRLRHAMQTRIKRVMISALSGHAVRGFQLLSSLAIAWFGVREMQNGRMSVGDFVAFNSYILYLSGPVQNLCTLHMSLQPTFAALERLMEMFRIVPECDAADVAPGQEPAAVEGRVDFEKVHFGYRAGTPVLQDISFSAPPGNVVALVGPSGGGKTTLINLLLAFYRPDSGVIRLDGRDIRDLDLGWLRRQIGLVSQEGFLFADSVRENIRYGRPDASGADVESAARAAHIHDEILALPDGYDTVVGERGSRLSVGQKQRISMARAFLKTPSILVFDEPTAALDTVSESHLKESLRALVRGRTTFIISHRLSMVDLADTILVIDRGRLVEQGTHEALMQQGGLYSQLRDGLLRRPAQRA